jgi:hypothetical protein
MSVSGGRIGSIFDSDARRIAYRLYEEFRSLKYDFYNVSANTGMSIEYTQMIKNYIFNDYHIQVNGTERFLPSYDIAQSWKRLSTKSGNNILLHDNILLYHELTEIKALLNNPNWLQVQAHVYANGFYNYQVASDQYYTSIGVKVR